MNLERELKLRLTPDAARRIWPEVAAGAAAPARALLDNVYLDTGAAELRAARAALRLRFDGRRWLQALKRERGAAAGLAERDEWEVAAPGGRLDPARLVRAGARLDGIDLAGVLARVRPVFRTRFERTSVLLALANGTRIEACLDRGTIAAGRRRERLLELELELRAGSAARLLEYAERLAGPGVALEPRSKAERGWRLALGEPAAPRKARQPQPRPGASAERALVELARASLAQIEANSPGVISGADPEFLHQLRVGMRRLRSALRGFRRLGRKGAARPLTLELRALTPPLGAARDWDVFAAHLADEWRSRRHAEALLVKRARARQAGARREATRTVGSPRFQAFLLRAARWLHERPWRTPEGSRAQSAREFARAMLERLDRKGHASGAEEDWSDAARRHALRIRLKRLRYLSEGFAACFDAGAAKRYVGRLKRLQDILGELNDIAVGRGLLESIGRGAAAARQAARVRRRMAEREQALISELDGAWRAFARARRFW